ncbi:hypothetical protein [Escherichia coli]|uniref:hypothetical protein n=1 Tax=Escherichia coli TaxID=562 RepID=UPI00202BB635|nr:hypothetical protein [Escherichia coli]
MKPDVKKIIADIKATKGNRKFCNGLAGTLQDDNYASSICKYVKTVTPERIDLLIEYAEKLEAEVTDMAVQLANAESKCRELAAENAGLKSGILQASENMEAHHDDHGLFSYDADGEQMDALLRLCDAQDSIALLENAKTPATDAFLAEVRAQGVKSLSNAVQSVIAERQRHQSVEGWTPEHDDEHCNGELAMAAVCYINETGTVNRNGGKPWGWPWDASWWKPNARRRNLVKAGALILAEIERIDRAAGIGKGE